MFNRLLSCANQDEFSKEFVLIRKYSPDMVRRKIPASLIQTAAMLHYVLAFGSPQQKILSAGFFEDVVFDTLTKMDWSVVGVDPAVNVTLKQYKEMNPDERFDLIFSTSVIEHVPDDTDFLIDIIEMLSPGGIGLLTCDFKDDYRIGDKLPTTSLRFYTPETLTKFIHILKSKGCTLLGTPNWEGPLDFQWEGIDYTFAGFAFIKAKTD